MKSELLLKECIKLIAEAITKGERPLALQGPFKYVGEVGGYPAIHRSFPLAPAPGLLEALGFDESELDDDGLLRLENEILIDPIDVYKTKAEPSVGYGGTYEVENYEVIVLNGLRLTPEDAELVKNYLGNLTHDENAEVSEWEAQNGPEPDYEEMMYNRRY